MYIYSISLGYRIRDNNYADDGFGNMIGLGYAAYWTAVDFDIDGRDNLN